MKRQLKIGEFVKYNNNIWKIIDINNLNPKEIYYRLSNSTCDGVWAMDNYIKKL